MRPALKAVLVVLGVLVAFGFGFSWRDLRAGTPPSARAFATLLGADEGRQTPTQVFRENYNTVLARFYRPIEPQRAKYAGMQGLMASLGDPHTQFMEPKIAEDFALETTGKYAGIGARLGPDLLGAKVAVVFKNSPAERAGLMVNDVVVAVDGKAVEGMEIDSIVDLIRGDEDTTVVLRVVRTGSDDPIAVKVVRERVVVPTVQGLMLEKSRVAYLTVDQFSETTPDQFLVSLADLNRQKPEGILIDLRQNRGGLLESAVSMLSLFLENKLIVTVQHRNDAPEKVYSYRGKRLPIDCPVVVLVDGGSASAAEIFAGAMRDYHAATIVGETTYGKASVQNVVLLRDMSTAKITTGRYLLPSGENISRKVDDDGVLVSGGLAPQVVAETPSGGEWVRGEIESDTQLQAAVRLLAEKRGG